MRQARGRPPPLPAYSAKSPRWNTASGRGIGFRQGSAGTTGGDKASGTECRNYRRIRKAFGCSSTTGFPVVPPPAFSVVPPLLAFPCSSATLWRKRIRLPVVPPLCGGKKIRHPVVPPLCGGKEYGSRHENKASGKGVPELQVEIRLPAGDCRNYSRIRKEFGCSSTPGFSVVPPLESTQNEDARPDDWSGVPVNRMVRKSSSK